MGVAPYTWKMLYNSGLLPLAANTFFRLPVHKFLLLGVFSLSLVQAHGINNPAMFDSVLKYQTGTVQLSDQVQIRTGTALRFLNGQDANHVIYDVWGGSADPNIVGMLLPRDPSPVSEGGWGLSMEQVASGYVDARLWKNLKAQDLLKKLQKQQGQAEVLGWAMPPRFDSQSGVLVFATEVKLPNAKDTAVLPRVVVLGRESLILMKGVIEKKHWSSMEPLLAQVGNAVQFQKGHRYTDVQAGDRVYDYGMTALITGEPVQDPQNPEPVKWLPMLALVAGLGMMVTLMGKTVRSRALKFQAD